MRFGHGTILCIVLILLAGCSSGIDTNMSVPMADFSFTTQDNDTLSLEDLKDDWWIANFAYTNCRTICPRTTANMAHVQERLKKSGINPTIVSFSIDPSHDTPEVLKTYAEENQASWYFLTGYDFETIQDISMNTFKAALQKGAAGQISHSYAFYLINPEGQIIKKYSGMSADDLTELVADMQTIHDI